MKCPKCGTDRLSVVDSRGESEAIRRRRECQECTFRFTTYERIELSLPLIIKKDNRREAFDLIKLRGGLLRACEKRPISVEEIDNVASRIEKKVHELCVKELSSLRIGDFVMDELKTLDHIAYIRFASVYKEFSDIHQFVDTLQTLSTDAQKQEQEESKVISES